MAATRSTIPSKSARAKARCRPPAKHRGLTYPPHTLPFTSHTTRQRKTRKRRDPPCVSSSGSVHYPCLRSPCLLLTSPMRAGEPLIKNGESIAFLGDSITAQGAAKPLGYVRLVVSGLDANGIKVNSVTPPVSAVHKSTNMLARLQRDVIAKKPTWMTLQLWRKRCLARPARCTVAAVPGQHHGHRRPGAGGGDQGHDPDIHVDHRGRYQQVQPDRRWVQ